MVLESPWWWTEFVLAWWILFPAYAANAFAPLAKGVRSLDFKMNWSDGRRLLGDGKTIEGAVLGIAAGTAIGLLEVALTPPLNAYASQWALQMPPMSILVAFLIALGVIVGDIAGSFIKRRLGLARGAAFPLVDQLDFVIGALLFSAWFIPVTPYMVVVMLAATFIIHRVSNVIAHRLRVKQVPW